LKKVISDQEVEAIYKMYKDGTKVSDIAKDFGVTNSTIYTRLNRCYGPLGKERAVNKRKYTVDESFFEVIDTQEKAYVIGWFYSDGSNSVSPNIAKIDVAADSEDILHKIKEAIGSNARIIPIKNSANSYARENAQMLYRLGIYNKKVSKQIAALGICGNVTYTRTWPKWLTEDLEPHFIRGLIDGDGCISITKKKGFAISYWGTEMMCDGLSKVLSKIGVEHSHRTDKKGHHFIRITKQAECLKFADYIYNDSTIHLARKFENYKRMQAIRDEKDIKKRAQKLTSLAMV